MQELSAPTREQNPPRRGLSPRMAASLVLATGILITLLTAWTLSNHLAREAQARFETSAGVAFAQLEKRLDDFRNVILGLQGLFISSNHVDRKEFHRYSENLKLNQRLPGLQALSFQRYVRHQDKIAFTEHVRNDRSLDPNGYPAFSIRPEGDRPDYVVIDYIEPMAANLAAFGYDAGTQAGNLDAIRMARDSGRFHVSAPIRIVQNPEGTPRLVLRAPVYRYANLSETVEQRRAVLEGFVVITIDSHATFGDFFSRLDVDGVRLRIEDAGLVQGALSGERMAVFDGRVSAEGPPLHAKQMNLEFGGRNWAVSYTAHPAWLQGQPGRGIPVLILAGGLIISLLLSALYLVQSRSRERAQHLARDMTQVLRATMENMSQGISVVGPDLKLIGYNQRFLELLDFPPSLIHEGMAFEEFVRFNAERGEYGPGDIEAQVRERIERARHFTPHRMKRTRPDGTVLDIIGTPLPGGGFVTTYADVTEQERIAAEIRRERDFRQHLIESIPGIFYLFDMEGHYLLWNRNHEVVTGYSAEEMESLHPLELFEGDDRRLIEERIGAVFTGGSATAAATLIARDGSRHPFHFTGERIALEDGRPALVGVGIDMTERLRIEEALARQTAVLQATLEAMDQGISVVDKDLRMNALNRRFCELLDFPEDMARQGSSFADFARFNALRGEYGPCDVEEKVREMVERARHVTPHRFQRTRPNGRILDVRGNPLPGGGFVTTYTDVTEQEHAQAEIRRERDFRQKLIESIPGIFFLFDRTGRFLLWNKNLESVLGQSADELARSRAIDLYDEADRAHIRQATAQAFATGTASAEASLVTKGGGRVPYVITGVSIEVDGQPSVIGLGLDITARKRAEAALRLLNETLEQRVRERTAELEASNQELESFSYSVSHDLRAPLRAMNGFSHLLEEEYAQKFDENGLNYLARIRAASKRMGELIDNLLDLAHVSRQELKRVPVDLSALACEIRESLEDLYPQRKVDWQIAPGLLVRADPVLIKALLDNLLRNAWKFTAERKDARIELSADRSGGETVYCVRDNGAGFEMAYANKLFKPFQRLHDPKRFEGTGIGLAIAHRVLLRHGGRIWAESAPGHGAAFYFTLS